MPSQLRQLFASILLFCDPNNFDANQLLKKYINDLSEDYCNKLIRNRGIDNSENLTDDDYAIFISQALRDIENYLIPYDKTLKDFSLPEPVYSLLEAKDE